jgi:hypothetical protein
MRDLVIICLIIAIVIGVGVGVIFVNTSNPSWSKEVPNSEIIVKQENITIGKPVVICKNESTKKMIKTFNFTKSDPQSLGNLPWDSMSGKLSSEEIFSVTGSAIEMSEQGPKVNVSNWSFGTRFKKIVFVIDQSYDVSDRKVYWASDVDIQRWNTFGVSSRDEYAFEKVGEDLYVFKDRHERICFVGYKLERFEGERKRIQSFNNIPWQNLSGNMSLKFIAQRLNFTLQGEGSEHQADMQLENYAISEDRGYLVASRGRFEEGIFSFNGTIYQAQDIQIQPGDYPGGINPSGLTPSFRLVTIRAGEPETKVYVCLFSDKDNNIVGATWTKDRLDSLAGGSGGNGGTSTYSSASNPAVGANGGPGNPSRLGITR